MKKRKLCNEKSFDMMSRFLVFEGDRIKHVKFSKSQIDEHSKETFMSALSEFLFPNPKQKSQTPNPVQPKYVQKSQTPNPEKSLSGPTNRG